MELAEEAIHQVTQTQKITQAEATTIETQAIHDHHHPGPLAHQQEAQLAEVPVVVIRVVQTEAAIVQLLALQEAATGAHTPQVVHRVVLLEARTHLVALQVVIPEADQAEVA